MPEQDRPTFTIVTLSFNQAPFLRRAIESVVSQRDVGVQYIVVDPGSTDGSREIIAEYGDAVDLVILDPDDGPADGLQRAFARAAGRYYGCINADDALLPGALERTAAAFRSSPGTHVVQSGGFRVDREGRPIGLVLPTRMTARYCTYGVAEMFQQGTFVAAEAFDLVGGYNVENRVSWDGEFMLRLTMSDIRWKRISGTSAVFTIHDEGITGSGRMEELFRTEQRRLFRVAMGREPRRTDQVILAAASKVYKPVRFPMVHARKLAFRLSAGRNAVIAPL